jgi:hypothetical protein
LVRRRARLGPAAARRGRPHRLVEPRWVERRRAG